MKIIRTGKEYIFLSTLLLLTLTLVNLSAQEYWESMNGPYGGSTRSMVFNNLGDVIVSSSWSGIFSSVNNGNLWNRVSPYVFTNIVVNSDNVLFGSGSYGGVSRSDDYGLSWYDVNNGLTANRVFSLAIDEQNWLYAGSDDLGVFRSTDGGQNWRRLSTGLTNNTVYSITTDLDNNVFAGTRGDGVFMLPAGDTTWTQLLTTGLSDMNVYALARTGSGALLAGGSSRIFRLDGGFTLSWTLAATTGGRAYTFVNPDNGSLFAATGAGIFRSDNDGAQFTKRSVGLENEIIWSMAANSSGILLAGTGSGFNSGIYRSEDNGISWTPVNDGFKAVRIWKTAVAPDGTIYAGSYDVGMFRSVDNGMTWEPINNGLIGLSGAYRIQDVTTTPAGDVFIATSGSGVFWLPSGETTWLGTNSGLPTNYPSSLKYFPLSDEFYAGFSKEGLYKSSDYGANWSDTNFPKNIGAVQDIVKISNGDVFAGTSKSGFYQFVSSTSTWQLTGTEVGLDSMDIFALAVNSKGYIFAATYGNGFFRSTDNGSTWNRLTGEMQEESYFRALAINSRDHIFTGLTNAYVSKNDGDNWESIYKNLPGVDINSFSINNDGNLLAGTNNGMYRSIQSTMSASVQFTVKMLFTPDFNPATDQVVVRGNFNNWGLEGEVYLDPLGDGDSTWVGWWATNQPDTILSGQLGGNLNFRFYILKGGGGEIQEPLSNVRVAYWDGNNDLILPAAWFGEPTNNLNDFYALNVLWNSTNGTNWTNYTNWTSDRPFSHWNGVTPNDQGQVVYLYLGNNNLNGTIPAEIGNLPALRELHLYMNNISGSIPTQLGQLQNLAFLNLFGNQLTGSIPAELGNLTKLVILSLNQNQLTGSIPASLGNLTNLEDLRLGTNQLSGTIPGSIWNLTKLKMLWLAFNQLTGQLPSQLGNLVNLTHLYLGGNLFSGNIPVEIGNLSNLIFLEIYVNQLSGSIPAGIFTLPKLEYLRLYSNQLSGTLPTTFTALELRELDIRNNWLTGSITPQVVNLDSLSSFLISRNQFNGLPDMSSLSKLQDVQINYNRFTFEDIEPNITIPGLVYSPQDSVGVASDTTVHASGKLTLQVTVGGANNKYQWYHDGVLINGATNNIYTIYMIELADAGTYTCTITNTVVTGLTLSSRPIQVLVEGDPPPPPLLLEPDSAATGVVLSPLLKWQPPVGAGTLKFHLQVNTSIDFTALPLFFNKDSMDAAEYNVTGLQGNKTYYWRVAARNDFGKSAWTKVWNFSTQSVTTVPDAPVLSLPDSNAVEVPTNPTLSWQIMGNAESYQVQVSKDINFISSLAFDQSEITMTSIQVSGLSGSTIYFWRVRATNTIGTGTWSKIWRFTTKAVTTVPDIPVLSAPVNGATGVPLNLTVIWNAAAGAETYQVQVNKSNAFTPPFAYDQDSLVTTSQLVTSLTGTTLYYWRVRASNTVGDGNWSAAWVFTTTAAAQPDPPVLTTPLNNIVNVSIFPILQWNAVTGVYRIQIDNEITLNSPFIDVDTLTQKKFTVNEKGLEFNSSYYWRVSVTVGGVQSNWSSVWGFTTESYQADIQLQNTTYFPTKSSPSDFVAADYRIYGIPGNDFVPLGDLLGGVAGTNWQAYWDNGSSANYMVKFDKSGNFNCITGRAFWLVSNGPVEIYMSATNAPLNSDQQAEINVHPGWNLISCPFLFAVSWDFVKQANGITVPVWRFTGNTGSLWSQETTLQPYVGYYFDNVTNLSKLNIPYKPALPKSVVTDKKIWQLSLSLQSEGLQESSTRIGIAEDAQKGWDMYDYRKPRPVGTLPGIYLDRAEWDESYGIFATDFRPPFDRTEKWAFTVTATPGQKVALTLDGVENIPAEQGVYLLDKEHLCSVDLRQQNGYSFLAARPVNEFEIIVGDREEIAQELKATIPSEFTLGKNFPNPFNPVTTIPITIPTDSEVNLKVYNLLGQEIIVLYDGNLNTGKHYFSWDGNDQSGLKMPSGIYLYRMVTDNGPVLTGKMVMVK